MMSFDYKRLPNLNSNPITVLVQKADAQIEENPNNYNRVKYAQYYVHIQYISRELGLKNMLEVDYFFDKVFQKIKKNLKPKK